MNPNMSHLCSGQLLAPGDPGTGVTRRGVALGVLGLWELTTLWSLQKSVKEGLLLKQTSSFQRWKRRYFKLRGRTLYYAKDAKVGCGGCQHTQPGGLEPASQGRSAKSLPGELGLWFLLHSP